MIGFLKGIIELRDGPHVFIDVHGVGYKVLVSQEVLTSVDSFKTAIKLFTYTHVKEDILELYGFLHPEDLKLFELLISVSGIGPKTAMAIFSLKKREEITQAIITGNVETFSNVPRLGKKNAQKIIIELKNKLGGIADLDLSEKDLQENSEVISALKSFGFSAKEAQAAIKEMKGSGETAEEKIRMALKYLGK